MTINIPHINDVKKIADIHVEVVANQYCNRVITEVVERLSDVEKYMNEYGEIDIRFQADYLNRYGQKYLEIIQQKANQKFNSNGWKNPVRIIFDDEGDAKVLFSAVMNKVDTANKHCYDGQLA